MIAAVRASSTLEKIEKKREKEGASFTSANRYGRKKGKKKRRGKKRKAVPGAGVYLYGRSEVGGKRWR